ncbi:MAG: hypothetical protein JWM44_1453 [Bacilli bacterium]|jgi:hypothetical protein|nr:hypothetical protein [Bacilli bacterium]
MLLSDPSKFIEVYHRGYNDGKWIHRTQGVIVGVAIAALAILAYRKSK